MGSWCRVRFVFGISLIDGRDWLLLVEVEEIVEIVFELETELVVVVAVAAVAAVAVRRNLCFGLVT